MNPPVPQPKVIESRVPMSLRRPLAFVILLAFWMPAYAQGPSNSKFIDLSLLVDADYPCTWPDKFPLFQMRQYKRIGPASAYNSDLLAIDGNTGTQIDVPPHSIPQLKTKLPNAGLLGDRFTDKIAAWQFAGEACVIDVRDLLDSTPNGRSSLVKAGHIAAWEKRNRKLRFGDAVLLRSGYSDKYYKPLPEGRRFLADPVEGTAPGWPDPEPDCMEFLASRGVMMVGTDSPSMGPIPDLAEPTHLAGLRHGMIFTEGLTDLDKLPTTGAFYCVLGPKHADGPYGEGRAFAIAPGPLAEKLIRAATRKKAVDLSVVLSTDLPVTWPGAGIGNHRYPYLKVDFMFAQNLGLYHHTHLLDSHAGTHLVPPSYSLATEGFDKSSYAPRVRRWLAEYETKYGPVGASDVTTDKVPIERTCGPARVIDVRKLVGTTDRASWPNSPEITPALIERYEQQHGKLKPGDIVVFRTGHTDKFFKPGPAGSACMTDPLNGKSEGWPAPGPAAIVHLAKKGIRCIATDGPTLGGVDPRRALMTYWALASNGLVAVEFLTNLGNVPPDAFFLFAAIKIHGCHGGPGRAIALY